jgi:hypothetical protein
MVKFTHLLVISVLIVWIAGSGCVGNDTSKVKEVGEDSSDADVGNNVPAEDLGVGLTQAELNEVNCNMAGLENLLEDSSPGEEIVVQEV